MLRMIDAYARTNPVRQKFFERDGYHLGVFVEKLQNYIDRMPGIK